MKFLVLGNKGMLGSEIEKHLRLLGHSVLGLDKEVDISNFSPKILAKEKITHVINCAAYTNVPLAERETEECFKVNAEAIEKIAYACNVADCQLVHFSTDFIFDGTKSTPYLEYDIPYPINFYGFSKYIGELYLKYSMRNYVIFRLQWLYGDSSNTFFSKILKRAKEGDFPVHLIDSEKGSPCSVRFVSGVVYDFLEKCNFNLCGDTYHLTHDDYCSRYDCGKFFLESRGYSCQKIEEYPSSLRRPVFGVMDNTKLREFLGRDLGSWKEDLEDFYA